MGTRKRLSGELKAERGWYAPFLEFFVKENHKNK
jgi:hypothetical protein